MGLLSVGEIEAGMVLERAIESPDTGKCLLKAGAILSLRNIEKLKELDIPGVYIKDRNTIFISPYDKIQKMLVRDFVNELYATAPKKPEANKNDDVVKVAASLEALIIKIAKNETILDFLVQLRIINKGKLYDAAVRTSMLSGLVAGCMNLSTNDITTAVIGGLLHDIGLAEMPNIINVENRNPSEENLWREHPTYGYYFAIQQNIPRPIAECIQCHHERIDGSGYPRGLSGGEIPTIAQIVNICANYTDSIVKKIPPYMAVEELYGASGIYYDPKVVKAFVNNIPIYPLGEMVRLSTKEVGIVANIRQNEGPRPIVKIYYNRVNRPISEDKIVDLGKERTIFIEEIL